MRYLLVNKTRRRAASRVIPSPLTAVRTPEEGYRAHLLQYAQLRPVRDAVLVWGLVLLLYAVLAGPAQADPMERSPAMPYRFSTAACYQLVQDAGRMIAWARWEQGYSLEKTRAAQFPSETPPWMIELVQAWITDAYEWHATDDQILQWASELGSVHDLPRASQLNPHETIAIWLRRIARGCQSPRV